MTHAVIYANDGRYSFFTWNGNTNPSAGVSLNFRISAGKVTASNAEIRAAIDNPGYVTVNQVGCNLWAADGKLLSHHTENCSRNENPFNVYYDISKELGVTLQAGQTYQYQLFAIYGGKEYDSAKSSFTTAGETPATPSAAPSVSPSASVSNTAGDQAGKTMMTMANLLGAKKTAVRKAFGSPKKSSASSMSFGTGKSKFGSKGTLTVKFKKNKVKSITWKLSYSGKNAVKNCRKFYQALTAGGNQAFGSSGAVRTSGDTTYTTWAGHVEAKCSAGGSSPCIMITAK